MNPNTDLDIRFIHDTEIGFTFAYTIVDNTLFGTASFCAKQGESYPRPGSRRPDQFARKTGRAIASSRLRLFFSDSMSEKVPYKVMVKNIPNTPESKRQVENCVRTSMTVLKAIFPGYFYRHADRASQIDNFNVVNTVTESLFALSIQNRRASMAVNGAQS